MKERLLRFLDKNQSRDIIINTLGNYLNVAFTAFFILFLVRILSRTEYGVLSVLLGIAYVLANVLDFGVSATIYSYLPGLIEERTNRTYQFIKTTFLFQFILSGIIIILLLVFFPYLDKVFFKTHAPVHELYITTFSVLFLIWQNFILNILFAAKKFLKANIYNNAQNMIKTVILFGLIYLGKVTVGSVIFVFGILGPIVFFLLIFIERRDLFFILAKSEIRRAELKFNYTFTYFFASQLYQLGGRMDLFLLSHYGLRELVGDYGIAQKIMLAISTTVISVTQVLSPNFAKVKSKLEALREFKHGFLYLLIPSVIYLLVLFTPKAVFDLFFTSKYIETPFLTKALVPAFIIFTLGNLPLQFILYSIKKPGYVLVGNILYFLIMTIGCYTLIPRIGITAPPVVNTVAIIFPVSILSIMAYVGYRKLPSR